ncbi:Na/Pi cotransporter family protein, partial [Bacteroidales bacterium AH-315-I05]|nr:Na/Pi cotransporter family protein [Bacteroidales bacterium AH-315-I05]
KLIGALGFFIYGMKVMSEGIQKVAGQKMRQILAAMTSNRFFGVFTGFLITCLLQSSSATTVMTVSFVNAGLLSLTQSIGVIMGANIGTTITGWLISIFGFKVKIAAIALPIIAVAVPMMFSSRSSFKSWAEFLIGFALLFLGLNELKNSVPDLKNNPEVLAFLSGYADMGMLSLLMFVGIGTLLTVIVQSSSAAMALTLVMCNEGWVPFDIAAGMILGENIGTTITANLAALVANVHAKRAARAHLIFNIFGVVWMLFSFRWFINGIDSYMTSTHGISPMEDAEAVPIALSLFHTTFNILNVLLLVWFVKPIEKAVIKMVPSKGDVDEQFHLDYISTGMMGTPELSLLEAKKEVEKFGRIDKKMLGFVKQLLQTTEKKEANQLFIRIKKYEDITDRMEVEIADYLLKVSEQELSKNASLRVRSYLSIIADLERTGDILYQMSKNIERKLDEKTWFTPEQRNNLLDMFSLLEKAFDTMLENLNSDFDQVSIEKANLLEAEINKRRNELRKQHFMSMEKGDYNIKSGLIYTDLFSSCEKVGDQVINVTEAVCGEI